MERKIGETFEFEGKTYKVVKFNGCINCAFRYNNCPDLAPVIGKCMDLVRSDGVKVMFEETENMEIKDNKLTIDIPEGMEIDILNSNFGTGVICFKKKQPEFKDGDIVVAKEDNYYDKVIFIAAIKDDVFSKALINVRNEDYEVHYNEYRFGRNRSLRLATDSEKQQLFAALEKEGKSWDAEKKQIVDLKPKVELKPFDKVLVRNRKIQRWNADLFGFKSDSVNFSYHCVGDSWNFCIPYIGNESLLGTTDNFE